MVASNSLDFLANAANYRQSLQAFKETLPKVHFKMHSAKVQCWQDKRMFYGDYSGVLTQQACKYLGENLQRLAGPRPTFERLHHAVTMPFREVPCIKHLIGSRPGCYIVRPDQYELITALAGHLASNGVVRVTFLESQIDHANHWASQFY